MSPWSSPPPVPPELVAAFGAYERALLADDVEALDRFFAPGRATLRGDADGLLVGHDAIADFRAARGGAPARRLVQTHVQVVDPQHALVVAVTEGPDGGRGQQTQLWARTENVDGEVAWVVTAAHVSSPAPALDTRVWRVVGDPLVPGAAEGPLKGRTVAVKDLYAVAGHRVGAGNPIWLAEAPVETHSAGAVQALLDAGADVRGIARTDELAYSLAGANPHHGTPPNPRAPHRLPGGSSSGPASAVSLGHADLGLGTDTAGSIRVPAAYQGLFGLRTTHDAVDRTGLVALAPRFDTVGWLTRDAGLLRAVGEVLLPPATVSGTDRLVVVPRLTSLADGDVAVAVSGWAAGHGAVEEDWDLTELTYLPSVFADLQAAQAWEQHRAWVGGRLDVLGDDVAARVSRAADFTGERLEGAATLAARAADRLRDLVGDRVLVVPSASSTAPALGPDLREEMARAREATLQLTCLAGIAGLPALSVPLSVAGGLPCGACLVAAPGRDHDLLALAEALTAT